MIRKVVHMQVLAGIKPEAIGALTNQASVVGSKNVGKVMPAKAQFSKIINSGLELPQAYA